MAREQAPVPSRQAVYEAERAKLEALFAGVEPGKRQLAEGLIQDAAYLAAENAELRRSLQETGSVRHCPTDPTKQRPVEAARQYRQNVGIYAVVIKALNSILSKDGSEDDDDGLGDYGDEAPEAAGPAK